MHLNGDDMEDTGQICFLFTDWSSSKAKFDSNYPHSRVTVEDVQLWSYGNTEIYIKERLNVIANCTDDNLPECTPAELWQDADTWAIKKQGGKRALKLYSSQGKAESAVKEGQEIEYRQGKAKRCNFCGASTWCKQYQELKSKNLIAE
jgi:hypothetical protein